MSRKIAPTPWEFENRPSHNPQQAHAVVIDDQGCVIFDTSNVDYRLVVIENYPDEAGSVYHQEGLAVESLKVAALAPELLTALKKLASEASGFLALSDPERHGQTNNRILRDRIEQARDIIAKAEGLR